MKNKDYQIKIGRGILSWECPRWHWIPGICWWPGLDEKGNTLKTRRVIPFPRWIFGRIGDRKRAAGVALKPSEQDGARSTTADFRDPAL
jgi:hypothetical protein